MTGRHCAIIPVSKRTWLHRGVAPASALAAAVATLGAAAAPASAAPHQSAAAPDVVAGAPAGDLGGGSPVVQVLAKPSPERAETPVRVKMAPLLTTASSGSGARGAESIDTSVAPESKGKWVRPIPGAPITSEFGYRGSLSTAGGATMPMHNGVDFGAPLGTPIHAANDGVVVHVGFSDFDTHTGGLVVIEHKTPQGHFLTSYNHMAMSGIKVGVGDHVTSGEEIAEVGNQGLTTGPHCHFSVRRVTGPNPLKDWTIMSPRAFFAEVGI